MFGTGTSAAVLSSGSDDEDATRQPQSGQLSVSDEDATRQPQSGQLSDEDGTRQPQPCPNHLTPPKRGEFHCGSLENKVSGVQSEVDARLQLQANMVLTCATLLARKIVAPTEVQLITLSTVMLWDANRTDIYIH